jgi:hypothetical protein
MENMAEWSQADIEEAVERAEVLYSKPITEEKIAEILQTRKLNQFLFAGQGGCSGKTATAKIANASSNIPCSRISTKCACECRYEFLWYAYMGNFRITDAAFLPSVPYHVLCEDAPLKSGKSFDPQVIRKIS